MKNFWPSIRRKQPLKSRRGGQVKLRIRSYDRDSGRNWIFVHVKVIMLLHHIHLMGRFLIGFGRILAITHLCIVVHM